MFRTMVVAALVSLAGAPPAAAQISDLERQRLVAHLEMTAAWLIDEVSDLSPAQIGFRRAPDGWSIMEVLEHVAVAAPVYWEDLQKAVRGARSSRQLADRDAEILWYGIDRTRRDTANAAESPKGQYRDLKGVLDAYRQHHARLLQYARTTTDDLRRRSVERQGCDAYQWALMISTHEQRHILQIREIKDDPTFPAR